MRQWFATMTVLLCLVVSSMVHAQDHEVVVDRIMARVNDHVITRSDLVRAFPVYLQMVARVSPQDLRTRAGQERVAHDLLEYMISVELIMEQAKEQDMVMSAQDVDDYLTRYRRSLDMDAEQFKVALQQEGVDYDDYKEFMKGYLTRMQVLRAQASSDVAISDEEIDQEMRARYPNGLRQPYFETSHIFLKLEPNASKLDVQYAYEELDEYRDDILAGEEGFEVIASRINDDGTRIRGGLVGSFTLGELDEEYTRAALALKPGEITKPVRSQFGMHLIRLESIEEREIADPETVKTRIRYDLSEKKSIRKEEAYLQKLRNRAFVDVVSDDFGM